MITKEVQWLLEEKYQGDENAAGFAADKARLAAGEPLAYVIGWQPFLGLRIHLGSRPLIPRPETEWWTEQLLAVLARPVAEHQNVSATKVARQTGAKPPFTFLDLCAGSGAIGCAALAHLPRAQVFFGELDSAHEPTIRKNIRENGLDASRADIRIGDLFEPFANLRFDCIVANPPYIPQDRMLPESVAAYEPAKALFAGPEGLDLIARILAHLPEHLAPNGQAWIEIDETQADAARALASDTGLSAHLLNDQYGVPRVLVVSST